MAERVMHDSQAAADLRMLLEAAQDAKAPAAAETSADVSKKNEKIAAEQKKKQPTLVGEMGRAADAAARGSLETTANLPIGVVKSLGGILNASSVDEAIQHLREAVVGAATIPFAPAISIGSAIAAWTQSLAPGLGKEILKDGSVIRALMGGHPGHVSDEQYAKMTGAEQAAYRKKQADFHAPMGLPEFEQTVIPLVVGGAAHAQGSVNAKKAAAPPPPAKGAAAEAKFNAATKPVEPPLPGKFEATPEWAAKNNARVQWETEQRAAAKKAQQQKPAESNGGAPAPGESVAERGMPIPQSVVDTTVERAAERTLPNQDVTPIDAVAKTEGMPGDAAEAAVNADMGIGVEGKNHQYVPGAETMDEQAVRIAAEYDAAKTNPADKPAWDALAAHTHQMFEDITKNLKVEKVTGQPYDSAEAMFADIKRGVMKVSTDNSEHPFWTPEQNHEFRVVHDFIGHSEEGHDFSLEGERKAYEAHAGYVPDENARGALHTEVYGQAASAIKNGAFPEQKAFLPTERVGGGTALTPEHSAAILQSVNENGGATFDPASGTLVQPSEGFAVSSTKSGETAIPLADLTHDKLAAFQRQHAAELAQPGAHLGAWNDNGVIKLDVTRVVPEEAQAHEIGRNTKPVPQKAIWDFKNAKEIPVRPETGAEAGARHGLQYQGQWETGEHEFFDPTTGGNTTVANLADLPSEITGSRERFAAEQPVQAAAEPAAPVAEAPALEGTEAAGAVPGAAEAPKAAEPLADPTAGTEGALAPPVAPVEATALPDPFLEGTEAAGSTPPPPPKTINDVQTLVQPVAETASKAVQADVKQQVATAADERRIRAEAVANAQAMRAAGMSRKDINEAFRARLNEAGIKSKNQIAMEGKVDKALEQQLGSTETPPAPHPAEDIQAQIARVKARIDEITKKLGAEPGPAKGDTLSMGGTGEMVRVGGELAKNTAEGAIRLRGAISESLRKNSETWNDLKAVGAGVLHYGARSREAWSQAMRETFGEAIEPHLKELYPLAQKQLKVFNKQQYERGLPSLEELQTARKAGDPGFEWYDKAPAELRSRFGENADLFAGTYAATSPLQDAATSNIDLAKRAYNQIVTGERDGVKRLFSARRDGLMPTVADNLNRVARGERVSGPKINPFEGQLRQDAFESGARNVPVLDTWMFRLFGFLPEDPSVPIKSRVGDAQRRFMETIIQKMAADEGADVNQIQAALWSDVKASVERRRAMERGMDKQGNFKPGWDAERMSAELDKINRAMGTPFDQLLRNRLGPTMESIRQGDMTGNGDALVARKATAAVLRNAADPEGGVRVALQALGMDHENAGRVGATVLDHLRQNGMDDGAGGIDLGHQEGVPRVPFDRAAAETAVSERLKGLCP